MEDHQVIELRSSATSLVMTYGGLLLAGIVLIALGQSRFNPLHGTGWSFNAVVLSTAAVLLILAGASYVAVALTRPKTLTLDRRGIRLRMRGKESLTPWQNIDQVIYTRMSFGKNTEPAVVVESRGRTALQFGSSYTISPKELFKLIDNYVKTRSIPVPVVRKLAWWESNLSD